MPGLLDGVVVLHELVPGPGDLEVEFLVNGDVVEHRAAERGPQRTSVDLAVGPLARVGEEWIQLACPRLIVQWSEILFRFDCLQQ